MVWLGPSFAGPNPLGKARNVSHVVPRLRASSCALSLLVVAAAALPSPASADGVIDGTTKSVPRAAFAKLESKAATLDTGKVRVIVGLKTTFDPAAAIGSGATQRRRIGQADERVRDAVAGTSHRVLRSYENLPYIALELSPPALRALEASGAAASIEEERIARPTLAESTQIIQSAPQVERDWDATGKVVAILDTGIRADHPFIAGKIYDEACFADAGEGQYCPNGQTEQFGPGAAARKYSLDFHMTAVAGVAAGKRVAGGTFDGVAPGAQILPVRVLDPDGTTSTEMLAGLNWLITRVDAGAPIASVNMSIGGGVWTSDCDSESLKAPIDALRARGIPTIIASGNETSTTGVTYPSCISTAITVGGSNKSDGLYTDTDSSSQVELLAPGQGITVPNATVDGNTYVAVSGTSVAAPHVAGAWASYVARYPGASVSDVLAAFQRTGKPILDTRNGVTVPRINLAAAMGGWGYVWAKNPTTATYSPASTLQANSSLSPNTISRTATGTYTVTFPKLGSGFIGNAQVRATSANTNRCKLATLGQAGTSARIGVRCYTPAGVLIDNEFIASFQVNEARSSNKAGYLLDLSPTSASETPTVNIQANSTGGTNTVSRINTGLYSATFPGFTGTAGVPQVTTQATNGNTCQILSWSGTSVNVICWDAAGEQADTAFSVAFDHLSVFTGRRGAVLYADQPTNTTAYTPANAWRSSAGTTTSVKLSTGTYDVVLGSLPVGNAFPMVTAASMAGSVTCHPQTVSTGVGGATVRVKCANASGSPVDSKFTLSYATSVI